MIKLFLTLIITVIFFIIIQRKGEGKLNKEIIVLIGGELCINKIENILDDILEKEAIQFEIINMYQKYISPINQWLDRLKQSILQDAIGTLGHFELMFLKSVNPSLERMVIDFSIIVFENYLWSIVFVEVFLLEIKCLKKVDLQLKKIIRILLLDVSKFIYALKKDKRWNWQVMKDFENKFLILLMTVITAFTSANAVVSLREDNNFFWYLLICIIGIVLLIYLTKKNKRKKDIEISEPDNTLSINIETVIACIMLVLFTIYHAHLVNMVP